MCYLQWYPNGTCNAWALHPPLLTNGHTFYVCRVFEVGVVFLEVELSQYTHDQRIYYTTFCFAGVSILAWRGHFASHGLCTKIREVEPLHALSHNQRYLNGTWCVSPVARVDTLSCQRVAKTKASETAMLGNHGMARTFCVCVEYKHTKTNTLIQLGTLNEV